MLLSDLSIKNPVLGIVVNLILMILGFIALERLSLRELPDIDPPVVSVETSYTGAAAQTIENRITKVLERRISGISGIRFIDAKSIDGFSTINIEFNLNRDIDAATNDVRERVFSALSELPDAADLPEVVKVNSDESVIMWLNLASNRLTQLELTDYADRFLVDELSVIDGVARVRIGGEQRYAMRIWLDRQAMVGKNVSLTDVEKALRDNNIELPAGRIESKKREFPVWLTRVFSTPKEFGQLVIRRENNGHLLRLNEIARITKGAENMRRELRGNGQSMIGLGIIKQSRANTLDVSKRVRAVLKDIKLPVGVELANSYDSAVFIEQSIHEVIKTLGIALVLVVFVIFVFLGDIRSIFIPFVTIPLALCSTFIILYYADFSLNLLTLLGLVLAIGLVVDDAIVVLENINRHIARHEPPLLASFNGTRQVGFAVVATTTVLLAVFLPISLLQGNVGRLFSEFAFTLAAAVVFSTFIALTLVPILCAMLLKENRHQTRWFHRVNLSLKRIETRYQQALHFCLRHSFGFIIILVLGMIAGGVLYKFIPTELVPIEDRGAFFIIAKSPEGTSYPQMQKNMRAVEAEMMAWVDRGILTRALTLIPLGFGNGDPVNSGFGIGVLEDFSNRNISTQELVQQLRLKLMAIPDILAIPIMRSAIQNTRSQPVEFVIGGSNYQELQQWRDLIMDKARTNPGLVNIDSDYDPSKIQFNVEILYNRAAELGVSVASIGRSLEGLLGSKTITTFIDRDEEYDVILEASDEDKTTIQDLQNIYVRSDTSGRLIPLNNVVNVVETTVPNALYRYNRSKSITITASLSPGYSLGSALTYLSQIAKETLPERARIAYKGESREYQDSQVGILVTFILALIIMFLVLAAQFGSFIHPLVIFVTAPIAIVGGMFGLFIGNSTFNIYSQIGMIMLIGLAAKNAILIVEFINQLRDQGGVFMKAVVEGAVTRLRPVLMTAISTLFGSIPLVLANGAGAENRFTIGLVIFFGISIATAISLFAVPVVYAKLAKHSKPRNHQKIKLQQQAQQHPNKRYSV